MSDLSLRYRILVSNVSDEEMVFMADTARILDQRDSIRCCRDSDRFDVNPHSSPHDTEHRTIRPSTTAAGVRNATSEFSPVLAADGAPFMLAAW